MGISVGNFFCAWFVAVLISIFEKHVTCFLFVPPSEARLHNGSRKHSPKLLKLVNEGIL